MVSLDSPMLTLGAMFIAGQDERGRPFTGGESGKGLLAGGFGGASAEYAADQVRSLTGLDTSTASDELMQVLVGAAVSKYGDPIPQNNAIARGIHYNAATQAFQDAGLGLGNLAGDITGGGGGGDTAQQSMHEAQMSNDAQARYQHSGMDVEWA